HDVDPGEPVDPGVPDGTLAEEGPRVDEELELAAEVVRTAHGRMVGVEPARARPGSEWGARAPPPGSRSGRGGRAGDHVRRQETRPAGAVRVAALEPARPEALPAAMLDVDPGRRPVEIGEPDLDLGRVAPVDPEVPRVDQTMRRLPGDDPTPVVLGAVGRPLEDPSADPGFDD